MAARPSILARRLLGAAGVLAGVTVAFHTVVSANPTTVALSYLVLVLLAATEWGLVEATVVAVAAAVCFNLFFLPPVGQLAISDPENWVSFIAFLLTAVVVSQLSGRARARQIEALSRQRDLERLYTVSRGLLLREEQTGAPAAIARQLADAFDLQAVVLFDRHSGQVARGGRSDLPDIEEKLRDVARQSTTQHEPGGLVVTAIRLGGAPIGSLALLGPPMSDTVLQSVANLVAIALERSRERDAATAVEAAQRSGELRTAILDAIAHEFKTPLTSIRAAVGGLEGGASTPAAGAELLAIIDEESQRLQSLVTDAIQMLRVEAGDFHVVRARVDLRSLVDRTIRDLGARGTGRIENQVGTALVVEADDGLFGLALRQVLDNALKYAAAGSTIGVAASAAGGAGVDVVVRNTGPAIPPHERDRIFERFYRGSLGARQPGSGMGLAIVRQIVRAHGGDVSVGGEADTTEVHLVLPPADVLLQGDGR